LFFSLAGYVHIGHNRRRIKGDEEAMMARLAIEQTRTEAPTGGVGPIEPGPDREPAVAPRLDYARALTAELLSEVAQLIGTEPALVFARRFGGRRLYIPRHPEADHPIVRCVGPERALILGAALGGESFAIPGARSYLRWLDARALRILRLSQPEISLLLGVQERHVRRLLQNFRPELYDIDDTVRAVGRLYGVRIARIKAAERARRQAA
jgi:hypothetical protein